MLIKNSLRATGITALLLVAQVASAEDLAQDLKQLSAPPAKATAAPVCGEPAKDPSVWDKSVNFGLNYSPLGK